jgi:hypothetical protein
LEIKSSLSQIKNIVEIYISRLEQVKDSSLGLEDKIEIKEKQKNSWTKDCRAVKRICKNSETPSKE